MAAEVSAVSSNPRLHPGLSLRLQGTPWVGRFSLAVRAVWALGGRGQDVVDMQVERGGLAAQAGHA